MRYALHVPNLADPDELVALGVAAEKGGWDGFLLWDHVFAGPAFPVPMADPWVVLGGLAVRTERIRLGTAVTPLPRRRPQKVARETVTVDRLSHGRMILGVGLGNPREDEYASFGEPAEPRTLAARLDEALNVLTGLWSGEPFNHEGEHFTVEEALFLPTPMQRPRIPIWTACQVPHRAPLARAARFDGVVLTAMSEEGAVEPLQAAHLEAAVGKLSRLRSGLDAFDVAVVTDGLPDQERVEVYADLGATWLLVTGWIAQLHDLAAREPHTMTT